MRIFERRPRAARKIAAHFNALQSDLSALRKDARALARGVGEAAGNTLDRVGKARNGAGKWAENGIGSMRNSVRNQPLAACLVSLGAGAVLGALLMRR